MRTYITCSHHPALDGKEPPAQARSLLVRAAGENRYENVGACL